jgi:hypothetical protein
VDLEPGSVSRRPRFEDSVLEGGDAASSWAVQGSIRLSCLIAARGSSSRAAVRSRMSRAISVFRRRRCVDMSVRSRPMRACGRICPARRSVRRLRRCQGGLRAAPRERDPEGRVGVFRDRARRRPTEVSRFIDAHRRRFGVERICRVLGVSASAYYQRASGQRSPRAAEDERLLGVIGELHVANTTPMATGAPGRRCCGPASTSGVTGSSG